MSGNCHTLTREIGLTGFLGFRAMMAIRFVHIERKKMRRVHNRRSGPMHFPAQELKRLAILSVVMMACSESPPCFAAEKSTATELIELAKTAAPGLRNAITSTFDAKDLK